MPDGHERCHRPRSGAAQNRAKPNRWRVFLILSCAKNDSVEIAETIIERETGDHSWSLRHRFDLATDLLDRVAPESPQRAGPDLRVAALLAVRQLDWQRRFNTQPRELAHAQDRLTLKLSERTASALATRPLCA